jgi:uncharacterized protein YkwD
MRKAPLSSCQPISQTAYVGSVVWRTVLCIAALATGGVAYADLPTVINAVRAEGCAGERPATLPVEPSDALHDIARVLALVNAARGESRRCGRRRQDAVPPVTLSRALTEASQRHADDMAGPGAFDHRGSDGSQPPERVSRTGYRWRATGENIAAGQVSADEVVASWLASPGHCTNVMGPQFTEMGVAYALAPSENPAIYWTQVFAAPQLP